MPQMKYGLISAVDSDCIEKTLDLVCEAFPDEPINITEVGLFNCQTSIGMHDYVLLKGRAVSMTGIDSERDKLIHAPGWMKFIRGKSGEVYNELPDNSQHFLFIDALHTFPAVVSDFFCYAPKVKVGGYIGFHDTGKHLDPLSGWQGVGKKTDPDMCLGGVRRALNEIGLLSGMFCGLELVFDEADPNDTGGGVCIFKKTL